MRGALSAFHSFAFCLCTFDFPQRACLLLRPAFLRAALLLAAALLAAFLTALLRGRLVLLLAAARTALLLAASRRLVDRGPRAPLGLALRHAALLVTFFDVFGLALLLLRVLPFVSPRHSQSLLSRTKSAHALRSA